MFQSVQPLPFSSFSSVPLTVIGRTSVLPYADPKQRNLKKIATDLGIGTVVEGTVSRIGDKVRIAVELVDAHTLRQLWRDPAFGPSGGRASKPLPAGSSPSTRRAGAKLCRSGPKARARCCSICRAGGS